MNEYDRRTEELRAAYKGRKPRNAGQRSRHHKRRRSSSALVPVATGIGAAMAMTKVSGFVAIGVVGGGAGAGMALLPVAIVAGAVSGLAWRGLRR